MISNKAKNRLYDRVQRVWVSTCLGVTAVTTLYIGWNMFNYFVYVKPLKKEMEERFKEELLREGRMLQDKQATLTQ